MDCEPPPLGRSPNLTYLWYHFTEYEQDFISHFLEFWPRRLIFFMHRRQINAEDWPRIWHGAGAQRISTNLAIDVDIG